LIPAGTGLSHHLERRRKKEAVEQQLAALEAESAKATEEKADEPQIFGSVDTDA